jgi:hypothetical protein
MTLSHLRQVAPPPTAPVGAGTPQQWTIVEAELGLELPADYKALVDTYRAGKFADFIFVYTPFARNPSLNLLDQRELNLAAYKTMQVEAPNSAPYPAYPEAGGVLPWAHTENGDVLYWLTVGPSDAWPTIAIGSRHATQQRYDLTTTEFLAQVIEGTLQVRGFPSDLLEELHVPFASLGT